MSYQKAWRQFKKKIKRRKIAWTLGMLLFIVLTGAYLMASYEEVTTTFEHDSIQSENADLEQPGQWVNNYFGIDHQGNLCLFDGKPEKGKISRTFFQLDIEYLESSLPKQTVDQLYAGIHVNDDDEYNSVLSTFSDYAVFESKEVLNTK